MHVQRTCRIFSTNLLSPVSTLPCRWQVLGLGISCKVPEKERRKALLTLLYLYKAGQQLRRSLPFSSSDLLV